MCLIHTIKHRGLSMSRRCHDLLYFMIIHACRYCLVYVYELLLREALDNFCESGILIKLHLTKRVVVPAMFLMTYNLHLHIPQWTMSCKQSLNFQVWSYCYLEQARKAPPFCPVEFNIATTAILIELTMWPDLRKPHIMMHFCKCRFLHQWIPYT